MIFLGMIRRMLLKVLLSSFLDAIVEFLGAAVATAFAAAMSRKGSWRR